MIFRIRAHTKRDILMFLDLYLIRTSSISSVPRRKFLCLHLMKVTHENAKSFQIRTENFYKKYTELLGVTKKVLRGYLHSMRSFFSVGKKDGKYFITFLASVFKSKRNVSETDQLLGHEVKTDCRRSKIKEIDDRAVEDTMQLVKAI